MSSFCVIPWLGMSTKPTGDSRVCCLMYSSNTLDQGVLKKPDGSNYNIGVDEFSEIQNAELAKNIRLSMLNNEQHASCATCWTRESCGNTSRRIKANEEFKQILTEDQARAQTTADGSIDIEPCYWDLRFGNLCNLKCVMCHPVSSSQWYEDYSLLNDTTAFIDSGKKVTLQRNENGRLVDNGEYHWWSSEFWKKLESKIPYLKQVYLVGGEPMLIEPHYDFLESVVNSGRAKDVTLEYDTNLTSIKPRAYELWKHFKKVVLRVSLEDFGEQNEYIRFPSNWKMIDANIKRVKEVVGENVEILTSCTWQVYNSFTFLSLLDHLTHPTLVRILTSPEYYAVRILPKETKLKLIEKYSKYHKRNLIGHLIKYLNDNLDYVDENKIKYMIDYSNRLDAIRGTNWKVTFAELYDNIKQYE